MRSPIVILVDPAVVEYAHHAIGRRIREPCGWFIQTNNTRYHSIQPTLHYRIYPTSCKLLTITVVVYWTAGIEKPSVSPMIVDNATTTSI
jgi:hypothetical protein